ncbi:MAG: hypothetical protein IIU03_04500, partial [Bacteroidales bacterium]|nr:hypothetical protein [Bacteroidales bacterium]
KELTGEEPVAGVPVTKSVKWDGSGTEHGVTFSTDYGSVFFPAAGCDDGNLAGDDGYYWSSSPVVDRAFRLYFNYGDARVSQGDVDDECSVRLVRGL